MIRPSHPAVLMKWVHNKGKPLEGYFHFIREHRIKDDYHDRLTGNDSFESHFVQLIGGLERGLWDRLFTSQTTLDSQSSGIAHKTHEGLGRFFEKLARTHPNLMIWGFGQEGFECLRDRKCYYALIPERTESDIPSWLLNDPKYKDTDWDRWDYPGWWRQEWDFIPAGWREISLHPDFIKFYVEEVLLDRARWAIRRARDYGFQKASTVAAIARHANSYGKGGLKGKDWEYPEKISGTWGRLQKAIDETGYPEYATEDDVMDKLYSAGFYHKKGKPSRLKLIRNMFGSGPYPDSLSADRLDFSHTPTFVDGSSPRYIQLGIDPTSGALPPPISEEQMRTKKVDVPAEARLGGKFFETASVAGTRKGGGGGAIIVGLGLIVAAVLIKRSL